MQCPSNSQILASRPESRKNRTTIKTNWKIEHVKNNKQNKCFLSFLVFSICFSCCFCFSTFRCRPPPCQCILPVIRSWPAGQNVEQNTENQETENNGNIENVKITNKTHACFTFYIFNCFIVFMFVLSSGRLARIWELELSCDCIMSILAVSLTDLQHLASEGYSPVCEHLIAHVFN